MIVNHTRVRSYVSDKWRSRTRCLLAHARTHPRARTHTQIVGIKPRPHGVTGVVRVPPSCYHDSDVMNQGQFNIVIPVL